MSNSPDPSGGIVAGFLLLYGFIILVALASFIFWFVEIVDVARREFKDSNSKLVWLLVVILGHGLGALIYYFAGRPQGWLPGETPLYPQYPPPGYPTQSPPMGTGYGQNPYPQPPTEKTQE